MATAQRNTIALKKIKEIQFFAHFNYIFFSYDKSYSIRVKIAQQWKKLTVFMVAFCLLRVLTRLSQNAKVLKCYAPYAFSGAKLQVFLENGHEIDVG